MVDVSIFGARCGVLGWYVGGIGVVTLARRLLKWCCWDAGERDPTFGCSCIRDGWVLESLWSSRYIFARY